MMHNEAGTRLDLDQDESMGSMTDGTGCPVWGVIAEMSGRGPYPRPDRSVVYAGRVVAALAVVVDPFRGGTRAAGRFHIARRQSHAEELERVGGLVLYRQHPPELGRNDFKGLSSTALLSTSIIMCLS